MKKLLIRKVFQIIIGVPMLGAPAQQCGSAKQEQFEEDHKVQLEVDDESKAVGG